MVYSSAKMTPYDQWRRYDFFFLLATNVKYNVKVTLR